MKNILLLICIIIPAISFSQVVFNSNGYSKSYENDGFPDELIKENTRFILNKNTIKIDEYEYRIKNVIKEKSLWSNNIIIEVTLISEIKLTVEQQQILDDDVKYEAQQGITVLVPDYSSVLPPIAKIEKIEVGYDMSGNIKYITTTDTRNLMGTYREVYLKYVVGSNFYKEPAKPSVNW